MNEAQRKAWKKKQQESKGKSERQKQQRQGNPTGFDVRNITGYDAQVHTADYTNDKDEKMTEVKEGAETEPKRKKLKLKEVERDGELVMELVEDNGSDEEEKAPEPETSAVSDTEWRVAKTMKVKQATWRMWVEGELKDDLDPKSIPKRRMRLRRKGFCEKRFPCFTWCCKWFCCCICTLLWRLTKAICCRSKFKPYTRGLFPHYDAVIFEKLKWSSSEATAMYRHYQLYLKVCAPVGILIGNVCSIKRLCGRFRDKKRT